MVLVLTVKIGHGKPVSSTDVAINLVNFKIKMYIL